MDSLGIPSALQQFEPSRAAALERTARISPSRYARTRNQLDGAVTGLSPYITHGFISPREALSFIAQKHQLSFADKLVQEFAWREFFQHVWAQQGDGIFSNLRAPVYEGSYAEQLPQDIREARTDVPAINAAVRTLYGTGYLHNHARMWLASYCVHYRKLHWRAGADWMYGHLLDGDLASNHLSWQWVAGTFSNKPYLFNADNVARYAPATAQEAWDCKGSGIDESYEALDVIARSAASLMPAQTSAFGMREPALTSEAVMDKKLQLAMLDGRSIRLIHPWHTYACNADSPSSETKPNGNYSSEYRLGVLHLPFHQQFPWSARRWQFVAGKFAEQCDAVYAGDLQELLPALARASEVRSEATLNPHYHELLTQVAQLDSPPTWLPAISTPCQSFSKFYERAQKQAGQLSDCLDVPANRSLFA